VPGHHARPCNLPTLSTHRVHRETTPLKTFSSPHTRRSNSKGRLTLTQVSYPLGEFKQNSWIFGASRVEDWCRVLAHHDRCFPYKTPLGDPLRPPKLSRRNELNAVAPLTALIHRPEELPQDPSPPLEEPLELEHPWSKLALLSCSSFCWPPPPETPLGEFIVLHHPHRSRPY
jgi:hypothetical protein